MYSVESYKNLPPVPATIGMVVRFLRKEGEDVARSGRTVAINGLPSTLDEMVDYANDLRFCSCRPPFRLLRNFPGGAA